LASLGLHQKRARLIIAILTNGNFIHPLHGCAYVSDLLQDVVDTILPNSKDENLRREF
jgi:hypothetical protein